MDHLTQDSAIVNEYRTRFDLVMGESYPRSESLKMINNALEKRVTMVNNFATTQWHKSTGGVDCVEVPLFPPDHQMYPPAWVLTNSVRLGSR